MLLLATVVSLDTLGNYYNLKSTQSRRIETIACWITVARSSRDRPFGQFQASLVTTEVGLMIAQPSPSDLESQELCEVLPRACSSRVRRACYSQK